MFPYPNGLEARRECRLRSNRMRRRRKRACVVHQALHLPQRYMQAITMLVVRVVSVTALPTDRTARCLYPTRHSTRVQGASLLH